MRQTRMRQCFGRINRVALIVVLVAGAGMVGCGDDEPAASWSVKEGAGDETGYGEDTTVVVTPGDENEGTTIVTGDPDTDECIELEGACVSLAEAKERECGDASVQADVVVIDGEVVDVICYPPKDEGTLIEEVGRDADGNIELPQNQNGAVIVFSEETNGESIEGDVTLEAERTVLYGNGVDNTILGGNLTMRTNNAQIRGLTVEGNLKVEQTSNNATISFCKVGGNLTVASNGVSVLNCQVFGNVDVTGNNATLINVGVQGEWKVDDSAFCDGCYSFDDEDGDSLVDTAERGDELLCQDMAS